MEFFYEAIVQLITSYVDFMLSNDDIIYCFYISFSLIIIGYSVII